MRLIGDLLYFDDHTGTGKKSRKPVIYNVLIYVPVAD
jgi:hypothetical protein